MRLVLGAWIDRFGTRGLWLSSSALFAATCLANLLVTSHTGVAIYALRISYCCGVAGAYGASVTFVTARGPTQRMAELVGVLGTAGFLGVVLGTVLGDALFGSVAVGRAQVVGMFGLAGLLGILSMPFAWAATRAERRPARSAGPPMRQVLWRHYSGLVLLMGMAMGMGLGLPSTFLRTYAAELDIPRISLFFTVYSATALVTRVITRHWFERFGTRLMMLLGVACLAVSQLLFLLVHAEWQLFLPAIGYGGAHAVAFPATVAACSMAFPAKHRGLATLLVLAAWDLGQLLGAPLAGALLRYSAAFGLPPYPTMFATMAVLLASAGIWYSASKREQTGESSLLQTGRP
jgi:MFS family permease